MRIIDDPRLDIDVQIEGTDGANVNVMAATRKDSLLSLWIEDAEGEAAIELSTPQVERLWQLLKRTVEVEVSVQKRKDTRGNKIK